jgi:nucleotide-binding universal stress UspA family protein
MNEARHETAKLKDGSRIGIRPITPDDREALAGGFERLSPESRYRRFFSPVAQLRDSELDYLTQVDHHDHEALVAVDEATGEGVAVARFVRIDRDSAEPAIVVIDEWQRRGVATALLDALSQRAREEGVRRFIAPVLSENAAAIGAFHRLGATTHEHFGREVELTVELTEPSRAEPVLRELLRAVASGVVEPARGLWELFLRQLPQPSGFGRAIVVGIEDSESCRYAVECAASLGKQLGLPVHLIGAYRPLLDDSRAIQASLRAAETRLRGRGVEVTGRLQRGDPAFAILYAATRERAGLIVVGSPPADAPQAILSSSLWNAVAHNSTCSVLVARAPDAETTRS